jgi:hypothetical protein
VQISESAMKLGTRPNTANAWAAMPMPQPTNGHCTHHTSGVASKLTQKIPTITSTKNDQVNVEARHGFDLLSNLGSLFVFIDNRNPILSPFGPTLSLC